MPSLGQESSPCVGGAQRARCLRGEVVNRWHALRTHFYALRTYFWSLPRGRGCAANHAQGRRLHVLHPEACLTAVCGMSYVTLQQHGGRSRAVWTKGMPWAIRRTLAKAPGPPALLPEGGQRRV